MIRTDLLSPNTYPTGSCLETNRRLQGMGTTSQEDNSASTKMEDNFPKRLLGLIKEDNSSGTQGEDSFPTGQNGEYKRGG